MQAKGTKDFISTGLHMAHNHIATHVVVHHNAECPATLDGLEPPTLCFGGKDSIHLRYRVKDMVAGPGFEPGSLAYEASGVPGLPYPAIENRFGWGGRTRTFKNAGSKPAAVAILLHPKRHSGHGWN